MRSVDGQLAQRLAQVEPQLRRALVAAYGPQDGREAAAEAIAWAWEHQGRLKVVDNLGGYLYRVGQTAARKARRRLDPASWPHAAVRATTHVEPDLMEALAGLSERQRQVVLMVHGYDYTLTETAETLGCSVSSVRVHLTRALAALRTRLEVTSVRD